MAESIEKKEFDNSLKPMKIALWISGIDLFVQNEKPLTRSLCSRFIFYFNFIWLHSDVCGEFYCFFYYLTTKKSLEKPLLIAPFIFMSVLGTLKVAAIFYNKQTAVGVLQKLRDLHPQREEPRDRSSNRKERAKRVESISYEFKLKKKTVKLLYTYSIFICLGYVVAASLFEFSPLILMARNLHKYGRTDLKLPYLVKFFFDPYAAPWWQLEYVHQLISSVIVITNTFAADSLFYAFCLYVKMHFEILCQRLEKLTVTKTKDASNEFKDLINRHRELIDIVNQIQAIFSSSMLFNIIHSSFTICLCGFNITFIKDIGALLGFFNFLLINMYQIFMICYFGDMIRDSSTKISEAIYNTKWYEADATLKNNVLILITRSQKPCSLSAAKFVTLDLRAFTTILGQSWSYFALLRTIYR